MGISSYLVAESVRFVRILVSFAIGKLLISSWVITVSCAFCDSWHACRVIHNGPPEQCSEDGY